MGGKRGFGLIGFLVAIVCRAAVLCLAVVGLTKIFPNMTKQCKSICENSGIEPPEICKKMIDKCCGGGEEGKKKSRKTREK